MGIAKILEKIKSTSSTSLEISSLENRNLIDEILVAVTRSTNILIICEIDFEKLDSNNYYLGGDKVGQPILDFGHAEDVNWSQLKDSLLYEYQDISDIEIVYSYIQNTEELILKEDYSRAELENQKALEYYSVH